MGVATAEWLREPWALGSRPRDGRELGRCLPKWPVGNYGLLCLTWPSFPYLPNENSTACFIGFCGRRNWTLGNMHNTADTVILQQMIVTITLKDNDNLEINHELQVINCLVTQNNNTDKAESPKIRLHRDGQHHTETMESGLGPNPILPLGSCGTLGKFSTLSLSLLMRGQ